MSLRWYLVPEVGARTPKLHELLELDAPSSTGSSTPVTILSGGDPELDEHPDLLSYSSKACKAICSSLSSRVRSTSPWSLERSIGLDRSIGGCGPPILMFVRSIRDRPRLTSHVKSTRCLATMLPSTSMTSPFMGTLSKSTISRFTCATPFLASSPLFSL